jgi:hypothetical protein
MICSFSFLVSKYKRTPPAEQRLKTSGTNGSNLLYVRHYTDQTVLVEIKYSNSYDGGDG